MTIVPAARAAADRFILDTANVKYIAEYLPKDAIKRIVPANGWTVGQTIGHLALEMNDLAVAIDAAAAGSDQSSAVVEFAVSETEHARASAKWSANELTRRLDAGLIAITTALAKFDPAQSGPSIGRWPVEDILDSVHAAAHGLDLADALEEMRFDPMMLNWLLYVDFSDKPELFDRQRQLLDDARAYFQEEEEDGADG